MTIHEFGTENKNVIVLIHPSLVMWDYFEYVIPLMQDRVLVFGAGGKRQEMGYPLYAEALSADKIPQTVRGGPRRPCRAAAGTSGAWTGKCDKITEGRG